MLLACGIVAPVLYVAAVIIGRDHTWLQPPRSRYQWPDCRPTLCCCTQLYAHYLLPVGHSNPRQESRSERAGLFTPGAADAM